MAEVFWSPDALSDLERVYAYIAERNPAAADRTARKLKAAGDGLAVLPGRGRPVGDGTLELTHCTPYIIRYDYDPSTDEVDILRVWHGAQELPYPRR